MSLLAPIFLVGLLGVALPIWLHRLNFRDPDPQPFSSSMFLQHSDLASAVDPKLRFLLLMAARILALAIVVLLFADPILRLAAPAGDDVARHRIFLIDRSLSMAAAGTWEEALRMMAAHIDDLEDGQTGQLIASAYPIEILTDATGDKTELTRQLNAIEVTNSAADYGDMMRAVDQLARENERSGGTDLVFVTDAQASNFPARFADLVPTRIRNFTLDIVAGDARSNWMISAEDSRDGVLVTVAGHDADAARLAVSVTVGNEQAGTTLQIDADGTAPASQLLADLPLRTGQNSVRLRLETQDALADDDEYFVVASKDNEVRVLIIAAELSLDDAVYIESALNSLRAPRIEIAKVYGGRALSFPQTDYAFVIVNDAGSLIPENRQFLTNYLERGGSVLLAAGPLAERMAQLPVTQHVIESNFDARTNTAVRRVVIADSEHPALSQAEFSGVINVYRWMGLRPLASDNVLITLENGAPWLIEGRRGAGRVLTLASPIDNEWSDLAASPALVPLVRGISRYLAGIDQFDTQAETGAMLVAGGTGETGQDAAIRQVLNPQGEPLFSLSELSQDVTVRLEQTGVYQIQTAAGARLMAVNTPRRESNLEPASPALRQQWIDAIGSDRPTAVLGSEATASEAQDEPDETAYPLHNWLLPLLILVLLLETVVANAHLFVRRSVTT